MLSFEAIITTVQHGHECIVKSLQALPSSDGTDTVCVITILAFVGLIIFLSLSNSLLFSSLYHSKFINSYCFYIVFFFTHITIFGPTTCHCLLPKMGQIFHPKFKKMVRKVSCSYFSLSIGHFHVLIRMQ